LTRRHGVSQLVRFALPFCCLLAGALLLGALLAPRPAWASVKLFMKDGSYQLVSTYEVRGDRVRYYSVERSEWEEMPAALVDFDATRRAQEAEKATAKKELEEAKEIEQQRFEKPPETGLEVAPGIRLPAVDGIYTVEGLRLVRLVQSLGEVVTDKKRLAMVVAIPLPLLKARSLVVLDGEKAAVRLNTPQPTFYVQSADSLGAKLELIRVRPAKESRVVEQVEAGRAGIGKATESRAAIPLERTQISPVLYKLKPTQPLEPGEYALGELVQTKLNLDVWDFGLDKSGAVDATAKTSKTSETGAPSMSEESPVESQPVLPGRQPPREQQIPHDPTHLAPGTAPGQPQGVPPEN
jgi:hypothetical protein